MDRDGDYPIPGHNPLGVVDTGTKNKCLVSKTIIQFQTLILF